MIFSELSLAEKESGLDFDRERLILTGTKLDFGVTVADIGNEYIVKIFAKEPYRLEKEITDGIISLSESLSKNTINSQRCEYGFVEIQMNKSCLLQEKLILLIDFLDKLTELMNNLGIAGMPPVLPQIKKSEAIPAAKNVRKIRLGFDFNSIKGLFGALLATFAMTFIASMSIKFNPDNPTGFTHIGAYFLSGAATALIFFDYRFLAKKIDPFGVIVCSILSVATSFLSSMTVGARSAALVTETSFAEGFSFLSDLYGLSPDLASFVEGYLLNSLIIAVIGSIIICVAYFNKHPDEMIKTEKIVSDEGNTSKT